MNILAIDTSTKYLCLAIAKDGKLAAGMRRPLGRELSGKIIPSIDAALKQSKLSLKAIDYFGIGLGPGSFTGLRIGLAVIKGLVFPFRKPVIGVGSLDVLARTVSNHSGLVCPVVDARRSLVYAAIYEMKARHLMRKGRYLLLSVKKLLSSLEGKDEVVFLGNGLNLYADEIKKKLGSLCIFADESLWYPRPESLYLSVKEKIKNKDFSDLHKLVPIYLYPKECQIKNSV